MPAPRSDVSWALKQFQSDPYRQFREYYAGNHRLNFATDKFRNAFGPLFQAFADNLCPVVVDGITERLRGPMGWQLHTADGPLGEDETHPLVERANALWVANRMDRRSDEVHRKQSRDGDAYAIVWRDAPGAPVNIWPQAASQVRVRYAEDDADPTAIDLAAKLFTDTGPDGTGRWRLTLYYRDRLDRLWAPRKDDQGPPDDPARWEALPDDETPTVKNDTGRVPVFHFADAAEGQYGRSDLADVIPLQDALNKAVADMLVAMEFGAVPQRWATGITAKVDPVTGRELPPMEVGGERMLTTGNENAQLGQFDTTDLRQFLEVQESFRVEIARVGGLPLWYVVPSMSGTPPSGEALKVGEARLVGKAERRKVPLGNTWEDLVKYALKLDGQAVPSDGDHLEAVWGPAETPSPKDDLEAALLKQSLGVSTPQVLRELGYTDTQIATMAAETSTGSADLAEQLLSGFDAGRA